MRFFSKERDAAAPFLFSGVGLADKKFVFPVASIIVYEEGQMSNSKKVFVVQGGDTRLRDDFFAFLRTMDLQPIEWSEALKCSGESTSDSEEVLEKAFGNAQAVIVLLSPEFGKDG